MSEQSVKQRIDAIEGWSIDPSLPSHICEDVEWLLAQLTEAQRRELALVEALKWYVDNRTKGGGISYVPMAVHTADAKLVEDAALRAVGALEEASVLILRDIPREQAKTEIANLFKQQHGGSLYYSDIAEQLALDLETVVDLCEILLSEGKIALAKNDPDARS